MSPANRPTSTSSLVPELATRQLTEFADAHPAWFMSLAGRVPLEINRPEFTFSIAQGRLIFSSWTQQGSRTWHVTDWHCDDEKLVLQTSRRMGAETTTIELVPRGSARALVATIAAARQRRSEQLAQLIAEGLGDGAFGAAHDVSETIDFATNKLAEKIQTQSAHELAASASLHPKPHPRHPFVKIERATVSPGMRRDQPGRYARIILRLPHERIAATAIVAESDARNVDSLFSSVLLWFSRLVTSAKRPAVNRLLIVVERNVLEAARQRHVLLRNSMRARIQLLEIDNDWQALEPTTVWQRKYLWRKRLSRFPPVVEAASTDRINEIVSIAPQAIDVVSARHGNTLRYHGLPFARVRRVMESESVWFGVEGQPRRLFGVHRQREFAKLLHDLQTYRNENCRDRRHWFYRAAGEAWLESILRRDITKLDPGLIIAPLHAQFRTSPGAPTGPRPIDLLALRYDGRLVVIELKVNEDREHVFQGVDYWRRVEGHRRRGHISGAKLFGDREISDESPLVYLVAPALRFHPSFAILARTIAPDIEIYRFDINEDWRRGVQVVRRESANA